MTEQSRQPDEAANHASSMEQAEGSRDNAQGGSSNEHQRPAGGAGITNRPLDEEMEEQESLPPRGKAKDGSHA